MKNKYLLLSAFFALGMFSAHAQFTNTNFGGSSFPQGSNPFGSLTLSTTGDTLFGMTPYGGAYGLGNIFCVSSSGYDDLLDFDDENGAEPYGSLTLSVTGDTLYGMTSIGGGDDGNIFSIIEDGSNFTEIYGFSGTDGAFPYGSLTRSVTGDTLFGMTSGGGTSSYGNVFCITTTGSYTDLLDFNNSNGAYPNGSLTLVKNHLFGMTSQGGSNNLGVLFAINTNTFSHTTLFNFDGTNGSYPYGSITASVTGDTLFGMTSGQGVSSYGNIFTYVIGSGLTDLLDFSGTDGNNPNGDLTLSRGVLFGMTNTGGSHSDGNIFSINPDGTSFIDLYDFYGPNGAYPFGSITFSRNEHKFFGMTSQGGEDGGDGNDGVIFAYDPLTVDSFQVIGVTCANKYQGSAAAVIIGGNPPYTYSWNPGGSTDDTITGLSAGSYTVTVTDNFGSTATSVAIVSGLSLIVTGVTNENCYGDSRGSITTNPSGGTAPYIYVWGTIISPYATLPNHGTSPTLGGSPTANMLSAGTYTITIKDACGDTAFAVATVTQPDSLAVSISPSHDTICAESPLALTSTTSGGTSPYTYSWFPGAGLSCTTCPNPTITPSTFTIDTLQVTDYNGCSATSAVSIGVISGIWTGIISTDWNDAGNWCGGVPTDTTNVVIPAGTPYSPATNTGTYAVCASLMISPGATLSNPQPLTVYGGITDSGTITAGNYIGLTGNWNNVGTFSANTYTVNFYGTSTQTINGATTFSTLDINNAAGVTDASAITVTTLTVGDTTSGSLLFDGGYQITSAGTFNLENSSMLKLGSSTATTLPAFTKDTISAATTVEYSSSSTQTVSGSPTYSNLILSGGSTKNLGGTTRVNAVLTLSSGSLALGSDTLTMGSGASISGASSSSYIQTNGVGTLRKLFNATGSFNYPVGDNVASTDYTPISLSVSSGSFPDYINVNTVNAKAPNNTSSSNYLNRYWKVTQNGSGTLNFNSIGTYLSGDVVGTSAHIFSVYSDTIWTQDSLINASSHTANVSGISINNSTATIVTGLEASASLLLSSGCTAAVKAIGEPPFTYAWSNGATTSSFSPAPPNTYSVVVTDGWGATGTISISNIHNFVILSVPILCFGYLGSVLSSSSGGSSPYTYSWSDGASQTTAQASGLSAGTYSVVVTDNIGCHLDVNWTLTQPNALEVTITNPVNLSCNGVCIGSATAVASGGGIGYIYSWAPDGQTTSTISALCAGTYTAYVHSIPDCGVVTATITISQPSSLGIAIESVSGILCNGGMGTATANIATGGTSPFTYSWSGGGGTNLTTTTLPAGTYTLTVTDNNHCYVSVSATITQPTVLGITMHSTTNVRCRYGTGTVTANMATGGTPAYVYSWTPNGGTGLTTTAISAGTYAIIVTDSHGCTASANVTLTQPLALSATATVTANNCNDGNEGSALVTPSGGTTPFIYSWSDANTQTTAAATGLSAGTYTATVTDDCSATTVAVVTISQPVIPLVVSIQSVYNVCGANTGTATATLNLSHTFSYEAAVQHWKVPTGVTTVTVAISGAGGGSEANETTGGGAGAMFLATCTVTPGDVLGVAIGQKGTTSTNGRGGGGGGATWVYDSSTTTLLAVAAGGGGSAYNANNGADGGTNLITNATISSSGGNSGTGGSGGSGGESGGSNSDNAGGGGAGWISNGQDDSKTADFAEGGNYQVNDFGKANSGAGTNSSNGYGGFGGGGQGGQEAGGGGGGYNGGGGGDNGAYGGGGGGSYLNGTVIGTATVTSTPNVNGSVTISYGPGGTSAYTYLWSNGQTSISATGLSAGSYTVTVTDHNGCMSQAITMISTYTAAASITVTQVSATTFSVTNVVSGAVYRWDYTDVWSDNYPLGYTYAGLGTVANLPVWPIAGTLTFWADSNSSCPTFTSVACTSTVSIAGTYTSTAYPRSSKRGMDIWAYDYPDILDGSPGNSNQDIENIVSYCSTNHITYVRIFDLMEDDSRQYSSYPYGIWVFGNRSTNIGLVNTYTPAYVTGLEYFISRLKAGTGEGGAGVEEVGVGYQTDDDFANLPPTTDQFTSVLAYNSGLNWDEKVDILTTDLEFWIDADYNSDFTNVHLPILKNMYSVSRYCNAACSGPNLRVEDYYSYQSTAITPRSEEDSIGKYSDRILYAEYTEGGPSNPTVNETDLGISSGDWYQSYDEFGKNPTGTYFKKEIWPEFSVENYTYTAVTYAQCQGNVGGTLDASGYDLWNNGEENHAEWIENYFFDNVVSYFGTKISGEFDYTLDTNFQILGNAWFFYNCMSQEQIGFSSTYLPYYVTVGPDYQWTLSSTPAVTFTATVNGGTSPFTYTWYNLDNGRVVFYSTSVNTCTVEFNPLANNYEVQRLGVVVKQSGITGPPEATYAIDYLCLYQQYNGGPHFLSPVHRQGNSDSSTITLVKNIRNALKIFPNPNQGQFTVELSVVSNSQPHIEIYSMMGQKIYSYPLLNTDGDNTINLNNEVNGVYFYRVLSESGSIIGEGKLIIEK